MKNYKSCIDFGGVKIYVNKSFSAFQKKMWKLLLGIDIRNF